MDSPAPDGLHDQVACALEAEATVHRAPVPPGQLDRVGAAEEVGCVEKVYVESVALDPFAAVEQAAQGGDPLVDGDTEGVLHGRAGTHLVGHGADATDPRRYVRGLGEVPPHQERLEETGRFEDLESHVGDGAVVHRDPQGSLSLDPRYSLDTDGALGSGPVGHGCSTLSCRSNRWRKATGTGPPWLADSARKAGASALNVANRRATSRGVAPAGEARPPAKPYWRCRPGRAAEATAPDGRAQGTTPGPGHRAQARRRPGHQQAHCALALALLAHRMSRHHGLASASDAMITSRSCRRSMGQPWSS